MYWHLAFDTKNKEFSAETCGNARDTPERLEGRQAGPGALGRDVAAAHLARRGTGKYTSRG